eukprot:gene11313-biopygen10899
MNAGNHRPGQGCFRNPVSILWNSSGGYPIKSGYRAQIFQSTTRSPPWTPGVTGHWRGRAAGMARAWRGLQGIFGLGGAGVARAWRGRGAGMSCD